MTCTGKHPTKEYPSISGLKSSFGGEHQETNPFDVMEVWKSWPQVGTSMTLDHTPYFSGCNAPSYSYQNENYIEP